MGGRLGVLSSKFPLAVLYVTSTAWLGAGTIAQLLSFVILARALGVEQFGLLMIITAVAHLGTHLCGLGAGEGMVRRVARRVDDYPALLGHNIILTLGTGVVLIVVLTIAIARFVTISSDGLANLAIILLFVVSNVFLYRWILLVEQIFIAHWKIAAANTVNVGFALAKLAVAVLACTVLGVTSLESWILWYSAIHFLWAGLCLASIRQYGRPKWRLLRSELRLGFHFSTPWFFMALRWNIDLLVLGMVAGPAVVGAFSVVKRVVDAAGVTSSSLERLLYPRLARAGKEGPDRSLAVIVGYLLPITLLATATSAALYIVAPWLPLIVGEGFADAVDGIRFLCWLLIVFALVAAAFEALGAADLHRLRARAYNGGSVFAAVVIGLSTYFFQVVGAFIAIYATSAIIGLLLWGALLRASRRPQSYPAAPSRTPSPSPAE